MIDFHSPEFEGAFRAEMADFQKRPPVRVEIDAPTAFMLVAQLQLALRHPQNIGGSRDIVEGFTRGLQERVAPDGSLVAQVLAAGWDPVYDFAPEGAEGMPNERKAD